MEDVNKNKQRITELQQKETRGELSDEEARELQELQQATPAEEKPEDANKN